MYLPPHFREERISVLHSLMRERPLATLVTLGSEGLNANHIPLIVDPDPAPYGTLLGHVARPNRLWRDSDPSVLVIFAGPEHYISPNWYPAKQEDGRVVPTWNYAAVHAHGTLQIHEDREWLKSLVSRLTDIHEAQFEKPWSVSDAPEEYIDGLLKGIVGIEIRIERLEGKWKMSQNRSSTDQAGAAEGLAAMNHPSASEVEDLIVKANDPAAQK
jgi:transcriptional regulator